MSERAGTDGAAQLRMLSRHLRTVAGGKERAKVLRKELREIAKPVVPLVRAAIKRIPSKGQSAARGRPSLRRLLARSVTLQVRPSGRRAGASVFMNPRKMPDGTKSLASYMEGTPRYSRLRHPVMGNRQVWVTQRAHPYFSRTVGASQAQAQAAMNRVVEATIREVESG